MISSSRWCGIQAYSMVRFILKSDQWDCKLTSDTTARNSATCLPNWWYWCAHMAVAWDYWVPRAWDLGEQQWSLAGAATWTTTSFPGDFDLGGTGWFQPWLRWRPFVPKSRYAGHIHKTSAKGHIFREIPTLAKELRKICERPVRVHCRTIYHDTSDRISHSQKTWPLWDCERFAKDLRKGSFLEPLVSPTLLYSCIDRTGSTDQLVSRNFVRRSSKGKVLNLYDFLLANNIEDPGKT